MPTYLSFAERFWSKVNILSDDICWDWLGAKIQTGYGSLTIARHESRKETLAHRISWTLSFGQVPGKLEVGHKCANRKCVNPAHLYLTTRRENNREVKYRKKYNYPNQVKPKELSHAQMHAKYIRSLWEIRNFDFTKLNQEKILQINGIIKKSKSNHTNPATEYKLPRLTIMPCSHDERFAIHEKEGTSWCIMCEYKIAEETIQKMKNLLELNDQ